MQMNTELEIFCKKEINNLLQKNNNNKTKQVFMVLLSFLCLEKCWIRKKSSKVNNKLQTLSKTLKWIIYPTPNKRDLLQKPCKGKIFSKFDIKSGFWQIQIDQNDRYKLAFTVPLG